MAGPWRARTTIGAAAGRRPGDGRRWGNHAASAIAVVVAVVASLVTTVSPAAAQPPPGPTLTVAGSPLAGASVRAPYVTELSDAATVTGAVTWLIDDRFAGRDTAAPYQWTVTATGAGSVPGQHRVKARWVTGTNPDTGAEVTAEVVASFRVLGQTAPGYEEPGAALRGLWATGDNRRGRPECLRLVRGRVPWWGGAA